MGKSQGEGWIATILDPSVAVRTTVGGSVRRSDWDLGHRILEDHMLHAVLAGGQEGTVAGVRVRTRPGDLLWVPAGVAQHLRLSPGERRLHKVFLRFRVERDGRPAPWPSGEPVARPIASEVVEHLSAAVRIHATGGFASGQRLRALLALVFAAWFDAAQRVPGTLDAMRRARLADLVAADPARRWDGRTLARVLGLSPLTLARLARRTWGVPLRTWILRRRLHLAAEDLRASSDAIAAVAARHGWEDPLLFSRQFRRNLGTTPTAWRGSAP